MRGSVWHIFNWNTSTWFCLLSLLYQNRSHKDNQPTGKNPASCNPLLMGNPSSNKDRVDNLGHFHLFSQKIKNHQSSRTRRNRPLFPPLDELLFFVSRVVVNVSGYGHTDRVDGITATDHDKKFNSCHLNNTGVNGLGLKIKSDFSTFVKYT